ncbi:hypothetical protein F5972_34455 [Microbispora cellulosiformans]|uniref:Uncharacterized protein n=1 Tax=Microbispora cellulosiformans TaxID=2614688 RepID=A0A5J5JU39_9ACTN|nr:hypothetical protein [Microbispora cellulosiformans]KAA9373688.1 hypothetical protein F5972_34455 [Microbispora cellulosiformans]
MSPPTGDVTLDPGRGMAWVDEHGAHLVDYASYHLESSATLTAVTAAMRSCAGRERPGNVTDRALLFSALRRECATGPGRGFLPGAASAGPDPLAVRRAWRLADPLGAETLRLLYRHELGLRDLVHVLALPSKEAGRLVARTQDVVEILVSGLDGLARGRPICPELAPLVAAVFPDENSEAADFGTARTALLTHIVTCVVCKRPINIRYTVPQVLSRPPVADLTSETRQRLLDALNRPAPIAPAPVVPVRRSPVPTAPARPSSAQPSSAQSGTAQPATPVTPARPSSTRSSPTRSPSQSPPQVASPQSAAQSTPARSVSADVAPARPVSGQDVPGQASPDEPAEDQPASGQAASSSMRRPPSSFGVPLTAPVGTAPAPVAPATSKVVPPQAPAAPATPDSQPEGGRDSRRDSRPGRGAEGTPDRPVRPFSQEDTQPSLVRPRGTSRPSRPPGAGRPPGQPGGSRSGTSAHAAPPGAAGTPGSAGPATTPGLDTPLYDALLSQIRARETAPAHAPETGAALVPALAPAPVDDLERSARPSSGLQIRIVAMFARILTLLRATAVRIVIVVVAGAAGTVTGINLFAPAPQPKGGPLEAGITQTTAGSGAAGAGAPLGAGTADTPASIAVETPAAGTGAGGDTPAEKAAATDGTGSGTGSGGDVSTDGAAGTDGATNGGASDGASDGASGGPEATATASSGNGSQAGGQPAPADTPASPAAVLMGSWGIQAPNVITLDAFGRGTISLSTTSGKAVKWRISAPGLSVAPSSGTLKPRHTAVLTVRALRVRYWCGVPAPTTTPLVLHGPKGERTATVRWSTC